MKCNASKFFLLFSVMVSLIFIILIILDWSDIFKSDLNFECDNQQLYNFLIILGTVASILIIHFFFMNKNIKSQNLLAKFTKDFYNNYKNSPIVTITWILTHFVMALLVGIFAPCYWKEIILIQTIWEIIECTTYTHSFLKKIWKLPQNSCLTSCGSWTDLTANSLGLIIGLICRKYIL